MTYRRSGVWPNRAATLIAEPRFSSVSRYCGKVSNGQASPRPGLQRVEAHALDLLERLHDQLAVRRRVVGATPKPQLPITVVVTPCQGEMLSMRSHRICAS